MGSESSFKFRGLRQMTEQYTAGTGAVGVLFEDLMDQTLRWLTPALTAAGYQVIVRNEQQIRDFFNEQSLNGVDHWIELKRDGMTTMFMLQEKWKLVTNQREVSQFLDCCARIKARLPKEETKIYRLWVTKTPPTLNGEKSLQEGGAYVVQVGTSMTMLAQCTAQIICELINNRPAAAAVIEKMPSLLPTDTPFEVIARDLEVKHMPAPTINPSKVRVSVQKA